MISFLEDCKIEQAKFDIDKCFFDALALKFFFVSF